MCYSYYFLYIILILILHKLKHFGVKCKTGLSLEGVSARKTFARKLKLDKLMVEKGKKPAPSLKFLFCMLQDVSVPNTANISYI